MSKVVVVTGAAKGIGAAIVQRFLADGWSVGALDICAQEGGDRVLPLIADVSNRAEVDTAVDAVIARFGQIDALVNNAGIILRARVLDTTEEDFERTWRVNVGGVFHCTQAVAPYMVARGEGHIVNISSGHALIGGYDRAVYAMTKAAIEAFTRNCARELGGSGILVNAVSPGFTYTEMSRESLVGERKARVEKRLPIRRIAEASEVAESVFNLATGKIPYMTGHVLRVDGGWSNSDVDYGQLGN